MYASTAQVIGARMNDCDDNEGQMIFGEPGGLKFPDICLTGEEKPRKKLTQESCPNRGSNPGPLRDRRACCRLAHSGGQKFQEIYYNLTFEFSGKINYFDQNLCFKLNKFFS